VAAKIVRQSVEIAASTGRTFRALIEPRDLKRWWGATEVVITPRKEGVWCLGWHAFDEENFYVSVGFIDKIIPGRTLGLKNVRYYRPDLKPLGPLRVVFDLESRGNRTVLTVRESGFGTGRTWNSYYRGVQKGWEEALWNLKRYLELKKK